VANLLAPTLGPLGGHVAGSANANARYELFDDAGTVVRRLISLGTPQADIGAMLMRNMIWRMQQRHGDGGTSAAVLARALAVRGVRLQAAGINPMELARGMQVAATAAVEAIQAQAQPISTEADLARLAYTITGHQALSAVLGEMRFLLGPAGHVHIDKLVAPYLERRYIAGAHFRAQISSMYFYTDAPRRHAVLAAPAVAIMDEPLQSAEAALALLEAALSAQATALLVLAPEISGPALNLLVANQQAPADQRKLALLGCKLTSTVSERSAQLADIGVLTGAALLGQGGLRAVHAVRAEDLGRAARVEFAHEGLTLVAQDLARADIRAEAEALQARLGSLEATDADRLELTRRLATLTGGVGELKIGANSQLERTLLFESATRALHVLTAAQRGGVVAGGGAALLHALSALEDLPLNGDQRAGATLLAECLDAPLRQIAHNAGVDSPIVIAHRVAEAGAPMTFDAFDHAIVDGPAHGVVDAAEVVIGTLRNAVSCALMALTTDTIVYHRAPEQSLNP
jgi:chaperonin GroEL